MSSHLISEVCSCEFCTMLDVMTGDPELNEWEKEFIKSVSNYGWMSDYSLKQKTKIKDIYEKQKKKWGCDDE